jgi:hypothetical protein
LSLSIAFDRTSTAQVGKLGSPTDTRIQVLIVATNLHRLGVCDKVIQQILRHANVITKVNIYEDGECGCSECDEGPLGTVRATTVQPERFRSTRIM